MSFFGRDSAQQHAIFAHQVESRHWNALDQRHYKPVNWIIGSRRFQLFLNQEKTGSWMKKSTKLGKNPLIIIICSEGRYF